MPTKLKSDKLKDIHQMQTSFMEFLGMDTPEILANDKRRTAEQKLKDVEDQTVMLTFALEREIDEVIREVNWKPWKKARKLVDPYKVHQELIDCFFFIMELMILWGMTSDDIHQMYTEKLEINRKRQETGY